LGGGEGGKKEKEGERGGKKKRNAGRHLEVPFRLIPDADVDGKKGRKEGGGGADGCWAIKFGEDVGRKSTNGKEKRRALWLSHVIRKRRNLGEGAGLVGCALSQRKRG